MKKTIRGSQYDTQKANVVCEISFKEKSGLFNMEATLYTTPISRRFFIAGEGGLMTILVKREMGKWSVGRNLIPVDEDTAEAITKTYGSTKTWERYFGGKYERR